MVEAAKAAISCLVVYFAGHGYRAADGSLCLALPDSDGREKFTGVPYDWVVDAIKHDRPQATIIILDCCYSGLAATVMDGADASQAAAEELVAEAQAATGEGVYIMASAAKDRRSLAPADERYTAFTGEIADMLERGLPGAGPVISVETIFATAQGRLRAMRRPVPEARSANTANTVGFYNRNDTGVAAPVAVTPAPATAVAGGPSMPRAVTAAIPHWRAPSPAESPFQLRLQAAASALSMEAARRVLDRLTATEVADDRLAVEWTTAPERLMGSWADIRRRHRRTDDPRHSRLYRASPIDLTGHIDDPLATFDAVPSERLAFLGAAGSGTSTVLHLLADQLGRRSAATGGPVPVILDPVSWEATHVPFRDWVVAELRWRYASARRWLGPTMRAARGLVDAELVFPVLDGLDRMSADNQAAALTALGESRFPFVLACRTDDYATAVELVGPPIGAAAVVAAPVAAPDAVAYVTARADAGSTAAAPLLRDVVKSVGGNEPTALQPLTEALRHPRTIGILVRSALGGGCSPAERLLLPDIAEAAGVELRTTRPQADPALTDIARQIAERAGHMLPWCTSEAAHEPIALGRRC